MECLVEVVVFVLLEVVEQFFLRVFVDNIVDIVVDVDLCSGIHYAFDVVKQFGEFEPFGFRYLWEWDFAVNELNDEKFGGTLVRYRADAEIFRAVNLVFCDMA